MCIQGSSRLMTSYVRPPNLSKVVVRHMISICADLTFDFWAEKSLGLLYESLLRALKTKRNLWTQSVSKKLNLSH